jgi:two-component system, NarL family, captular synthesis response regulator RcsB
MTLRVVIADDHPVVITGIKAVLSAMSVMVVAEAHDTDQLMSSLKQSPFDLLITDFNMPGGRFADGLDLLAYMHRHHPKIQVIVVTMLHSPGMVRAMLDKGANGVFDKRDPLSLLQEAVSQVSVGQTYLSPGLIREMADAGEEIGRYGLSPRELEVLRMFANGLSGREIAERLNRSEKTVSHQKRRAMQKLGISHDSMLRETAVKLGLFS